MFSKANLPMSRALIGHTGFVGSHLRAAGVYSDLFNSSNFRDMAGREFDEITCAGVSAVKWLANKEPEKDWGDIKALLDVLANVKAKRFTLISTIDIYPDPRSPWDETEIPPSKEGQPYGRHRLLIEEFVKDRFSDVLIVRLPALFGAGLKKNVIFDLLHANQTEKINPAATFQWYPIDRLAHDIKVARNAQIELVNLFTAPIENKRFIAPLFPYAVVAQPTQPAPYYNLRTRYAEHFGGCDGFIMNEHEIVEAITGYVRQERNAGVS